MANSLAGMPLDRLALYFAPSSSPEPAPSSSLPSLSSLSSLSRGSSWLPRIARSAARAGFLAEGEPTEVSSADGLVAFVCRLALVLFPALEVAAAASTLGSSSEDEMALAGVLVENPSWA